MNGDNINNNYEKKTVLVAPLDWGLGHATRCIPIIKELLKQKATVLIAAEKQGLALLKKEFPQLAFLDLPGYRVKYSSQKKCFFLKMLLQYPAIQATIVKERRWLKKVVIKYAIDLVISDNRFGLYHSTVPCIFITHQLQIQTGNNFLNLLAQKINYRYIENFTGCWVPDIEKNAGIAGRLSHPAEFPKTPVTYIGTLSRFTKKDIEQKYKLLILLSGPEPQRSIFEKKLLHQLKGITVKTLLLKGLPNQQDIPMAEGDYVTIHNHLSANDLNDAIVQSDVVIARSGYSTVMDLIALQKKALLVPTPGQKEQEYLADYLSEKKWFGSISQDDFKLEIAISFSNKTFPPFIENDGALAEAVKNILHKINF